MRDYKKEKKDENESQTISNKFSEAAQRYINGSSLIQLIKIKQKRIVS